MNLYLISQSVNTGYDTYSDAVVAAESEEQARNIHPDGTPESKDDYFRRSTWAPVKDVQVELIGIAKDGTKVGVICASFHAG